MLPNNDLTTYFLETLLSVTNTAVSYHVPRLQYCDLHTDMQGLCFHQHISKNERSKSWKPAFAIIWNIILSMYIIHSHSPPYMLKHTWHHTHVHACKDSSARFHYVLHVDPTRASHLLPAGDREGMEGLSGGHGLSLGEPLQHQNQTTKKNSPYPQETKSQKRIKRKTSTSSVTYLN